MPSSSLCESRTTLWTWRTTPSSAAIPSWRRRVRSMRWRSRTSYDPPVAGGFVVPLLGPATSRGRSGLPVEKAEIGSALRSRRRWAAATGSSNVSSKVPKWLLKFLGGVVGSALRLGKRRTCADDIVESPRRVIETRADGSVVWLGHEEFQYRAYDVGRDPHENHWRHGELGIRAAQGGAEGGRNGPYAAHVVGRIGFAQSEYYFDGVEDKSEWLWKQRWRARLRRFRISRDWIPSTILGACSGTRGRGSIHGLSQPLRSWRETSPSTRYRPTRTRWPHRTEQAADRQQGERPCSKRSSVFRYSQRLW